MTKSARWTSLRHVSRLRRDRDPKYSIPRYVASQRASTSSTWRRYGNKSRYVLLTNTFTRPVSRDYHECSVGGVSLESQGVGDGWEAPSCVRPRTTADRSAVRRTARTPRRGRRTAPATRGG